MEQAFLNKAETLEFQRLQALWKLYWTKKLGSYPDKIEKVVKKLTFEEFNKQKEQGDLEFREFIKENVK